MQALVKYLPRRQTSALIGWLAAIPLPSFFARRLIAWYCKRYHVETHELANELSSFDSLSQFFVRDLKVGARIQSEGLTSPCDGELRSVQTVTAAHLEQVKGITYSLTQLLGNQAASDHFEGGNCFNLYLSPRDYHQVHAPLDAEIKAITYIPGTLWPVNDWALSRIDGLFCANERVVIKLQSAFGLIALVMVGAFNVGSIRLACADLITNRGERQIRDVALPTRREIKKGDKLGAFYLGSSVVLLTPAKTFKPSLSAGVVRVGDSLAKTTSL